MLTCACSCWYVSVHVCVTPVTDAALVACIHLDRLLHHLSHAPPATSPLHHRLAHHHLTAYTTAHDIHHVLLAHVMLATKYLCEYPMKVEVRRWHVHVHVGVDVAVAVAVGHAR